MKKISFGAFVVSALYSVTLVNIQGYEDGYFDFTIFIRNVIYGMLIILLITFLVTRKEGWLRAVGAFVSICVVLESLLIPVDAMNGVIKDTPISVQFFAASIGGLMLYTFAAAWLLLPMLTIDIRNKKA